jgi:hypothetical protein
MIDNDGIRQRWEMKAPGSPTATRSSSTSTGTDWRPKGSLVRVKARDFEDKELGKVVPYGVCDIAANEGFVSLGITADTAEFAVEAIRTWIGRMGRARNPRMRVDDHGRLRRLERRVPGPKLARSLFALYCHTASAVARSRPPFLRVHRLIAVDNWLALAGAPPAGRGGAALGALSFAGRAMPATQCAATSPGRSHA